MAPCGCKKKRQQQLVQQPPTVIHLPSGKIEPVKQISEEEQKIIDQIKEELLKLHQQNQ